MVARLVAAMRANRFALSAALVAGFTTLAQAAPFQLSFSDQDLLQNGLTVIPYASSNLSVNAAWQTVTGPYTAAGSQLGIPTYNNKTDQNGNYADDGDIYGSDPNNPNTNTTDPTNSFFVGEFELPASATQQSGEFGMVVLLNQTFTLPSAGSYFTDAAAEVHVRNLLNEDGSNGGGEFLISFVMGQIDPVTNTLELYTKGLNGGFSTNDAKTGQANQGDWFKFGNVNAPVNWSAFQGQSIFGNAGATPSTTRDTVFGFYISSTNTQVSNGARYAAFAADNFAATVYGQGSATTSTFNLEALTVPEPSAAQLLTFGLLTLGLLVRSRRSA